MHDEDQLSPIERMAISARQSGAPDETPSLRAISLRVPLRLLASIDAFVQLTGQSRNTAMINLLEAGVYAVRHELDNSDDFDAIEEALITHLTGE